MGYPHLNAVATTDAGMVATVCAGHRGPEQVAVIITLFVGLDDHRVDDDVRAAVATVRSWWERTITSNAEDLMATGTRLWRDHGGDR